MSERNGIRWGWLKAMYFYTIVGAGGFGLGMIFAPELIKSLFSWPVQEPIIFGMVGSVYLAFAILSFFGLRAPLKFASVLLLQLCYKSIWFIAIILPVLMSPEVPIHAIFLAIIFATYIIGDLIAIPFPYVLSKEEKN